MRSRPQVPGVRGLIVLMSGIDVSVMLNIACTDTPKRAANPATSSMSGTMNTWRSG
ncbi:Uncharacterised protein [Mycobacteroides abscessus subsp. abscessus]|nr:Uncharacterised protein [Mycobacteroides abscessus subsp. abscessus]